jgi:DNA-directed RNA polymerase subunit RPC12/RpoP
MSKMHIFIDGSWLFKACAPERALANRLEYPDRQFKLDFGKLSSVLLRYASNHDPSCSEFGDRFFSTSIFSLPENLDEWPAERDDVSVDDIASVKSSVIARDRFTQSALDAGFSDSAIFRPRLKGWMLQKLRDRRFQEKQVDTTVVALLVKSAIINPNDYHVIITGDADILPAVRVAYPDYSRNVFVATTHPDQLRAESRQTSFSISDFNYVIEPYYMEKHAHELLTGDNVYVCSHCNKAFSRPKPIPKKALACCSPCNSKRT